MRNRRVVVALVAGALVLAVWLRVPRSGGLVGRYVATPVPASVRVVGFQSNDRLGIHPEPVCYLRFTATEDDLGTPVTQGGFRSVAKDSIPVLQGPPWWRAADQRGAAVRVYSRVHAPANPGSRVYAGKNRRWSEYLWIDETRTNAFFLLWGV